MKSFTRSQEEEEAFDRVNRGIRSVPLNQIVGSVGRYHDFDNQFRLKRHMPQDRLQKIKEAMRQGKIIPPVKLYQIKDEYYVLDGNHRISAAKELNHDSINAKIIELLPSKKTFENLLYHEKLQFKDQTGLSQPINLTEIGQYSYLIKQISNHKNFLKRGTDSILFTEAASDWFKTIYCPLIAIVQKGRLLDLFPERTLADLYIYISYHQWERGRNRKYGIGIDNLIPNNMEAFREKMVKINELEYPEMQREITAFILINVKAKKEHRIIEKLFSLSEVKEIHSINGNIDILVKIVLKRDLLSSDSEIISQFVEKNVRRIPGITSTQTLIPGFSKIKDAPASEK